MKRQRGFLLNPFRFGTLDPYWANVLSLLHFDGANGSTTIVDSAAPNWTAAGSAQLSTAQAVAGPSSLGVSGAPGYITRSYNDNFNWWQADFTLEAFLWLDSYPGVANTLGHMDPNGPTNYWSFGVNSSGMVEFYYFNGSLNYITGTGIVPLGQWVHIVMTQQAGTIRVGHEGVLDGTASVVGTPQASVSFPLTVGQVNGVGMTGYVDELRITRGVARYTGSSYAVPPVPFPSS